MGLSADELVARLGLKPHPEGGFYKETYRSTETLVLPRGRRSVCTAILYLLPEGGFSALHRIKSDELWFHHAGGDMVVAELAPDGTLRETVLGPGKEPQHVVPAGAWFGAYAPRGSGFSLVSCTVSPGFDFADFEMGSRADLLKAFPSRRAVVEKLTRP